MGDKELQRVKETASSSFFSQSDTIIIPIQLHVNQIELFHRLIKIIGKVDDLTRVRINKIQLPHRQFRGGRRGNERGRS